MLLTLLLSIANTLLFVYAAGEDSYYFFNEGTYKVGRKGNILNYVLS